MSWLISKALMNSLCSQEQVEESLGESSLDGTQSVPLNGNPILLAYCVQDKMMDFSRLSRYGMTYKLLTENRGEELLTLYLEGFHAKTFQRQEKEQELTESDQECGSTWRGWLAKYDPNTSSWRTAQCSLLEDLNESLETLPRSGMTRNGLLWELPMLEQTIKGTESGLSGNWPTPRSCSATSAKITQESAWNPKRNPNLETIVGRRMFPTPTAHNAKEAAYPSEYKRNTPTLATHAGGELNPMWVEWLMGWPINWTSLEKINEIKFWSETNAKAFHGLDMSKMWWGQDPSQAPFRSQPSEQQSEQYSNSLRSMPQQRTSEIETSEMSDLQSGFSTKEGKTSKSLQSTVFEGNGQDFCYETMVIPRISNNMIAMVDRLKAIGNGQVPLCAATAWRILCK